MSILIPGIVGKVVGALVVPGILTKPFGLGIDVAPLPPFSWDFAAESRVCQPEAESHERVFATEARDNGFEAEGREYAFPAQDREGEL